jgi:hypothetical protein
VNPCCAVTTGQACHHAPARSAGFPRRLAMTVCTALALATAGCAGATSGSAPSGAATSPAQSQAKAGELPGEGSPPIYWTTVRQRLAAGLHATVPALTALWSSTAAATKGQDVQAVTTILDVATEHGISLPQLRSLELTAIQQGCEALERLGNLSPSQAVAWMREIRAWHQGDLDGYSMFAFQAH